MSITIDKWEELPLHQMCRLFPEMNEEQYETLVMDIKKNGLIEPIIVYEVFADAVRKTSDIKQSKIHEFTYILDGQNRRMACLDAGVEPHFDYYLGDDPLQYVISKNVGRRHLTTGQLAALAAGIANMNMGDNQFTHDGEIITMEQAASMFGTSPKSVQRFRAIQDQDSVLAQKVARGEETLNVAYLASSASRTPPTDTDTSNAPFVARTTSTSQDGDQPPEATHSDSDESAPVDTGDTSEAPTKRLIFYINREQLEDLLGWGETPIGEHEEYTVQLKYKE